MWVRHRKTGLSGRVLGGDAARVRVETLGVGGRWGGASSSRESWARGQVEELTEDPAIPERERYLRSERVYAALERLRRVRWSDTEEATARLEAFVREVCDG